MPRAPLRIGILSLAHVHADGYARLLLERPDVRFVGVSDDDPQRGARAEQAFGVRWFARHEDLLAEGLDGVLICSENALHRAHVALAAAAGAHVLCEKPIATTLEDAEAMRAACARAGVRFMTAFPMRFDASVRAAKDLLARGDLGELYAVNGINHSENPRGHRAWFAQRDLAGGGAVMDHTVHLVDLLRWYTGSEVREVYAEVANPFDPEVDVDTAGIVTLTFGSGLFAAVDCSWSRPAGIYPRWGHLKMELVGARGVVSVDAFGQYATRFGGTASRPVTWHNWGSDPNRAMLAAFLESVREAQEPPVTWRDGYEALKVALACYASAARAQPVALG
ncbi:Gfo/Idh/MocA family protein [Truepera radiovictrix]|uniref:Oxidoreductase domain protein n=1 Tax=Truepera radiovictrix (strain DSM 17093 / CIP 108686 / LMG 22925 / RQ-24) TaxID=649638 RepID=D7CU79_TRURR|nr:Gfo/Idh/MocA family oxidoreductase [Truepera radiovictrix]ADI13977.1 oxidoreductase domain protein [Truepera radiovictrix DSM 17093]WMT58865.1 Gfo/Idh/MocA family oxidoreductase [Truepera radiovictrix]